MPAAVRGSAMATTVPALSIFFSVADNGLRLTLPAWADTGASRTKPTRTLILRMRLTREWQHALHHLIAAHEIMIKRARHVQGNKPQKDIDQNVVDAACLVSPGSPLRRQCGQRRDAEKRNRPTP